MYTNPIPPECRGASLMKPRHVEAGGHPVVLRHGLVNPRFGEDFASTQLKLVAHTFMTLLVRKELCPGFLDIGGRVCSQGHGCVCLLGGVCGV